MKRLLLIVALVVAGCAEPETHVIPEGFKGHVYIVQSDSLGAPETYEDGRRLYHIPADGLVLTRFGSNDGLIDARYFYVGADGVRREIADRTSASDASRRLTDTTVAVRYLSVGVIGNANVPFEQYFVGTASDLAEWDPRTGGEVSDALARHGIVIE